MIYFDNAATTKCCNDSKNEYIKQLDYYGNSSSEYKIGRNSKKCIADAKYLISRILNCKPENIYFTSGGSESDSWAILKSVKLNDRKTIITSEFEHSAVLNSCNELKKNGYNIIYLKPNCSGIITPDSLRAVMSNDVALVSIMFLNNEIGTVQPIKELAKITHEYGSLFHCDAVQAVGHLPLNLMDIDIDFMSSSSHKFYGPKGCGFLYIKNINTIGNLIYGGHQQNGIRPGTENSQCISAMAKALEFSDSMMEQYLLLCSELKARLVQDLIKYKINYKINGIQNYDGIISLCLFDIDNEALVNFMDLKNICISYGSACNTGSLEPSHVLKSIGLPDNEANSTVRLSFSYENTVEEIDSFVKYLSDFISLQVKE